MIARRSSQACIAYSTNSAAPQAAHSRYLENGYTETLTEASSFHDAACEAFWQSRSWRLLENCLQLLKNLPNHPKEIDLLNFACRLLLTLFMTESTVAVFSSAITSGSTALLNSPRCGLWSSDPLKDPSGSSQFSQVGANSERWATVYARNCYNAVQRLDGCNLCYTQAIKCSETQIGSCPFLGDVCMKGPALAYTLDTGFVNALVLGFNSKGLYDFRRSTCVPLIISPRYVKKQRTEDESPEYMVGPMAYFYKYGPSYWGTHLYYSE